MLYAMIIGTLLARVTGCTALFIATLGAAHAEINFSDAPIRQGQPDQAAGAAFRVIDFEDPVVKKRREQSEDMRSSCRKGAALTAKTELGVRVLIDECEREHQKRLGE